MQSSCRGASAGVPWGGGCLRHSQRPQRFSRTGGALRKATGAAALYPRHTNKPAPYPSHQRKWLCLLAAPPLPWRHDTAQELGEEPGKGFTPGVPRRSNAIGAS